MDLEPRVAYATTRDGVSIAYWAVGDGPTVVVPPPGLPFSHIQEELEIAEWRHWYEHLARHFHIVRYDNRGAGLSDRDAIDYSIDTHLADLQAVIDALRLDRFSLFGTYFAGLLSIAYAARHPERIERLTLWAPVAHAGDAREDAGQQEVITRLMEADYNLFTETVSHRVFGWGQGAPAHRFAAYMRAAIEPDAARACWRATESMDVRHELANVACPTLVMHRRQIEVVAMAGVRAIASAIPDARLLMFEGESLAPYIGEADPVLRAMYEFFDLDLEQFEDASHAHARAGAGFRVIFFTDIVGSTETTQRIGDEQAHEMVRVHNRIVRDALHAFNGDEVKHTGDGIMASFTSAVLALECGIAVQRRIAAHLGMNPDLPRFSVRIGMNAGEPVAEGGDLFGTAVQLASRVCALASPQQILVSDVLRQLVAGKGFLFSDHGESDLRGFDEPVRLFEVRWRDA